MVESKLEEISDLMKEEIASSIVDLMDTDPLVYDILLAMIKAQKKDLKKKSKESEKKLFKVRTIMIKEDKIQFGDGANYSPTSWYFIPGELIDSTWLDSRFDFHDSVLIDEFFMSNEKTSDKAITSIFRIINYLSNKGYITQSTGIHIGGPVKMVRKDSNKCC